MADPPKKVNLHAEGRAMVATARFMCRGLFFLPIMNPRQEELAVAMRCLAIQHQLPGDLTLADPSLILEIL